jgi:hypothetical protein
MEAARSSGRLVSYSNTTRRHNPGDLDFRDGDVFSKSELCYFVFFIVLDVHLLLQR